MIWFIFQKDCCVETGLEEGKLEPKTNQSTAIVQERRNRGLTSEGGSGNEEKWTPEIYLEVDLTGISDGLHVEGGGEGEIEDDFSMINGRFLEFMHLFNLVLT